MQVVLDNVRSIQNVATCFRTGDGIGVDKFWLCGYTPTPLDKYGIAIPKFAKISLGAEMSIDWEKKGDVVEVLRDLKSDGGYIVGVETGDLAQPYYGMDDKIELAKIVLVLGSETDGLSHEVLSLCDAVLEIPMSGIKESLNVALAFGVVGFVLRDLRNFKS